jgi:hypothetical protein
MVKQREHEVLDRFAVLKKSSPPGGAVVRRSASNYLSTRTRQPVFFKFFAIAAAGRIGEKGPAFSADIDENGPGS